MKITKAQALYTFHPDVPAYTCQSCMFEKDQGGKDFCVLFGPSTQINEQSGTCNLWVHGEPERQKINVPWLSVLTKIQAGYAENLYGFSCKRCVNFLVGKNDCSKVDRDSPGDTHGMISPDGCCNLWVKDPRRGNKNDTELVQILSSAPVKSIRDLAKP